MAMEIIDGHAGQPHINGEDLAALNIGTFGDGDYVLSFGDGLEATMTTSNQVTVGTGALVHAGRRSVNLSAQSLVVQSGTQGQKRNDLVVSRYSATPSGSDTIESEDLVVIKGTPVSYGEAADPEITDNDMPLWRIPIDGITPGTPVQLFEVMKPMSELWDSVSQSVVRPSISWPGLSLDVRKAGSLVVATFGGESRELQPYSTAVVATGLPGAVVETYAPCSMWDVGNNNSIYASVSAGGDLTIQNRNDVVVNATRVVGEVVYFAS